MQRMKQTTMLTTALLISLAVASAGCGDGSLPSPTTPATQNISVTGQYNLVLTSASVQATTSIYTNFTQTGTTFTGAANTLVCPSNDPSQCNSSSSAPSGMLSGAKVTILVSFLTSTGADVVTMIGSVAGTTLTGTYTDSLGDSGTWTASPAIHPFGPPPSVYAYSGTFNSTSNPLPIAQAISLELGASSQAVPNLTGNATIMNSPCVISLTLSGQAIGDAFTLTDAISKISIIALPTLPFGNGFNFSYKFETTAASCPGDFGLGVLTINASPWDY